MHDVYDFDKLTQLLNNLYIITGQKFTLKSRDFNDVTTGHPQCEFCKLIQNTIDGYEKCLKCNSAALERTKQLNQPYTYRCHCGLIETAIPIANGKAILAYLMFGQVLDNTSIDKQWSVTKRLCSWYNDTEALKQSFYKLSCLSDAELKAYTDVLAACASYIWLQNYVRQSELSDTERLIEYIDSCYKQKHRLKDIAHELGMSKTKLCETARRAGITINGEITSRRIEDAKKLITNSTQSIATIADSVGISDYSYFSRLFKTYTGMSPSDYRKNTMSIYTNH